MISPILMCSEKLGAIFRSCGYVEDRDFKIYKSMPIFTGGRDRARAHGFEAIVIEHDRTNRPDV